MPVWVDGSPQPVPHTADVERELTEMLFVADLGSATTDLVRQRLAEFARTLPHGFVRDNDARAASNSNTMRRPIGKRN